MARHEPALAMVLMLLAGAACVGEQATPTPGRALSTKKANAGVAKRSVNPLLDDPALAYVCTSSEHRTFKAAWDAKGPDIEKLAKMDWQTADAAEVRRLSYSGVYVDVARQIDLAIDLQGMASTANNTRLAAAWADYGSTVAKTAGKKWESGELSSTEERALAAVVVARQVDWAAAFMALKERVATGQFAEAFAACEEDVSRLAKKDWKTQEASDAERTALDALTRAYAMDLAGAVLALPQSADAEALKAVKQHLITLAKKTWRVNEIERDEELALCQTLRAYSDRAQ